MNDEARVVKVYKIRVSEDVCQIWTKLSCGHDVPIDRVKIMYCPQCGKQVSHD